MCSETSTTYTCNVSAGTQGAVVHLVSDYVGSTGKVQAWGLYEGSNFCCQSGPKWNGAEVEILGSDYGDTLFFVYDGVNEYLESSPTTPTAWSVAITKGTIEGNGGNDSIRGSIENVAVYNDYLYGGDGEDTLKGLDGDDFIWGGDGEDTITGDKGVDIISGGPAADIITGGPDNDTSTVATGETSSVGTGRSLAIGSTSETASRRPTRTSFMEPML